MTESGQELKEFLINKDSKEDHGSISIDSKWLRYLFSNLVISFILTMLKTKKVTRNWKKSVDTKDLRTFLKLT